MYTSVAPPQSLNADVVIVAGQTEGEGGDTPPPPPKNVKQELWEKLQKLSARAHTMNTPQNNNKKAANNKPNGDMSKRGKRKPGNQHDSTSNTTDDDNKDDNKDNNKDDNKDDDSNTTSTIGNNHANGNNNHHVNGNNNNHVNGNNNNHANGNNNHVNGNNHANGNGNSDNNHKGKNNKKRVDKKEVGPSTAVKQIRQFLNPNPQLRDVPSGRLGVKTPGELEIEQALADGDYAKAMRMSDKFQTHESATQVLNAISCVKYAEDKKVEDALLRAKKKPRLDWTFDSKARWERKGNM